MNFNQLYLETTMITPKNINFVIDPPQNKKSKPKCVKSPSSQSSQFQDFLMAYSAIDIENRKNNILHTQNQNVDKFKLPQINNKVSENQQTNENNVRKSSQKNSAKNLQIIQANPYLRKYADLKNGKITRDVSCHFLNIVSVKPIFRSSSRMSSKDVNQSLNQQKNDKLHTIKGDQKSQSLNKLNSRVSTISFANKDIQSKSKRKNNRSEKQIPIKKYKLSLKPNDPIKHLVHKKKSMTLIKIQKPKQSPNYSEWCLLIGIIDGAIFQKDGGQYYRACVGKGNNSVLVKNILKSRPWWTLCQDQSEANLFWTQGRSNNFLATLKQGKNLQKIEWENTPRLKMELFGNCQSVLTDRIQSFVKSGFDKILSKSQRQILSKSSISLTIPYPTNIRHFDSNKLQIHNHLQSNWNLSNKKALYYNLKSYYLAIGKNPFLYIPQTYHVQKEGDDEWNNFLKGYQKKGLWIIKPGQNSNRGCGIDVIETLQQVRDIVKNKSVRANGKQRSHIVQRYLMPFLYNKRKFDIRCYMLVTSIGGNLRCYWYEQGYIRTASKQFTTKNLKNRMIHLTNDAVQKHSQSYGKHQSGNKLSFNDFQRYLKNNYPQLEFYEKVYPKMMELATDAIRSTNLAIDEKHRQFSFQIFGLDFMIDEKFDTWLIEVNTNPCLELSCPLLARIIPNMVENALRIALDPIFPPPRDYCRQKSSSQEPFQNNKFTLIFSSSEESELQKVLGVHKLENILQSEDEESIAEDEQ